MMGRTHLALGLVAGALAPVGPVGWEWAALALGAVAPDLDSGHALISTPSAWLPRGIPAPRWLDGLAGVVGRVTRALFGHRGLLHTPLLSFGLVIVAALLHLDWLNWFAVGYAVHLLADSLTKEGIPVFGPFSFERRGLLPRGLRIKTGSGVEGLIAGLAWIVLFWMAFAWLMSELLVLHNILTDLTGG